MSLKDVAFDDALKIFAKWLRPPSLPHGRKTLTTSAHLAKLFPHSTFRSEVS
ncbi:hypothetical protein PYK22_03099 [Pyrinomonas methylaliphatogenes]|uniref:Uncharacterized protein n=1 Tax=Pyrinomonas methylaliphatogenes TaxID=454194 RepID=A0A0B6X492_9BACT|nr:hypothetical protein PYK22_03099 [Pyrinomonas methylaliphatogenes]